MALGVMWVDLVTTLVEKSENIIISVNFLQISANLL